MKYLFYPFENYMISIVNEFNENSVDAIEYLVVPKAWKKTIKECACKVTDDYDYAAQMVESIIFSDPTYIENIYEDMINKIIGAIKARKKIICLFQLQDKDKERIEQLAENNNTKVIFKRNDSVKDVIHYYNKIDSVVIGIGSSFNKVNDVNVIIGLEKNFRDRGYKVAVISTNANTSLLDYYYYPFYAYEKDYGKVVQEINRYVNNVCYKTNADVVIVQIPGCMVNYSRLAMYDCSVESYIFSRAVNVDYFVFSSFVDESIVGNLKEMSKIFYSRYGFEINSLVIDNFILDNSDEFENEELYLEEISLDSTKEYIEKLSAAKDGILCGLMQDENLYKKIVSDCIDCLGGGSNGE